MSNPSPETSLGSIDTRNRDIIEAYQGGRRSVRTLAAIFELSTTNVNYILRTEVRRGKLPCKECLTEALLLLQNPASTIVATAAPNSVLRKTALRIQDDLLMRKDRIAWNRMRSLQSVVSYILEQLNSAQLSSRHTSRDTILAKIVSHIKETMPEEDPASMLNEDLLCNPLIRIDPEYSKGLCNRHRMKPILGKTNADPIKRAHRRQKLNECQNRYSRSNKGLSTAGRYHERVSKIKKQAKHFFIVRPKEDVHKEIIKLLDSACPNDKFKVYKRKEELHIYVLDHKYVSSVRECLKSEATKKLFKS
ncbi:MAG: hypothetical protein WBB28_01750 [Crinalium sp.]